MTQNAALVAVRSLLLQAAEIIENLANGTAGQIARISAIPYLLQFRVASTKHSVSVRLLAAVSKVESDWDASAFNPETTADKRKGRDVNAVGLMQILYPDTANDIAHRRGIPAPSQAQLYEPTKNLDFGAWLLRDLLNRFPQLESDGFPADAVSAYNAGSPRRNADGGRVNQTYVDRVRAAWIALEGLS